MNRYEKSLLITEEIENKIKNNEYADRYEAFDDVFTNRNKKKITDGQHTYLMNMIFNKYDDEEVSK